MHGESQRPLQRGDLVEVRPPAEILATLDESGTLDGVPFMPEMLRYIGKRFRVSVRVEKFCDTIQTSHSRRIHNTVYLENLRCDGSGHGGCQAACRIYWKEDWLVRTEDTDESTLAVDDSAAVAELTRVAHTNSTRHGPSENGGVKLYRCQATQALAASEPLNDFDPTQYVREVRSGNVGIGRLATVGARAAAYTVGRRLRLVEPISIKARLAIKARPGVEEPEPLGLQVGDWVQVRSAEEIGRTLNEWGKNRGLWFDREMRVFCGGIYRVKRRIERIINERTGAMIELKSDCWVLDGVVCTGNYSAWRWLCPREIPSYWREAWLRRVDPPEWATLKPREQADSAAHRPARPPTEAA